MPQIQELKKLNIQQHINLWGELWSYIVKEADLPLTDDEKKLLDERYDQFKKNPEAGKPWGEVYDDLKSL